MFENKTVFDQIKSFDVYRKLPKDYLQPTFIGAVLSVISISLMIILFISEFRSFINIKTSSEMLVDTSHSQDLLKINIDIVLNKLPCSIVSLDVQDMMGNHAVNIHGKLLKNRVDRNGGFIEQYTEPAHPEGDKRHITDVPQPELKVLQKEIKDQEGCQLVGNINVMRVPGNFHISSHAYGRTLQKLIISNEDFKYDISHKINHISFGDESDIQYIKNTFGVGNVSPLDGVVKEKDPKTDKMYEYYLKVVPTNYNEISGKSFDVNQFTSNSNEVKISMQIPTIYFRFDIAPILVRYEQYRESSFEFFIQICAIVGGIYSVIGILDTLVNRLFRSSKSE